MVNEPETWRRRGPGLGRQVARAGCRGLGAALEKPLHQAVLERMKGDDDEPPAGPEHLLGGRQGPLELAQLVVGVDAQGLEDAGSGMPAGDPLAPQHARDELPQLLRARDRLAAPLRRDGARNGARAALLAEVEEDVGKPRLIGLVEDFGGAWAG